MGQLRYVLIALAIVGVIGLIVGTILLKNKYKIAGKQNKKDKDSKEIVESVVKVDELQQVTNTVKKKKIDSEVEERIDKKTEQNKYFTHITFPDRIIDFLTDPDITEVQVRENGKVWVVSNTKGGILTDLELDSKDAYRMVKQSSNVAASTFNKSNPILDVGYQGWVKVSGEDKLINIRINAIDSTISGDLVVALRNVSNKQKFTIEESVKSGYMTKESALLLVFLISVGHSVVVGGATGTGKTELIKTLSEYVKGATVTIEDTKELYLEQLYKDRNIISLTTTLSANFRDLIKASLRQNPDSIILAETRGEEVLDLINAQTTGHQGISTIHARECRLIPRRMQSMANMDDSFINTVFENLDIGIMLNISVSSGYLKREVVEIVEYLYLDGQEQECVVNTLYSKKYIGVDTVIHSYGQIKSPQTIQALIKTKNPNGDETMYDYLLKNTDFIEPREITGDVIIYEKQE